MILAAVPPERAAQFWPLATRYVYAAMDRVGITDKHDVEEDVLAGRALLWLVLDGPSVCGSVVTQLHGGVCEIVACGLDDLKGSLPLLEQIEQFARDEGCSAVRLIGRRGWSRVLTDYRPKAVILEKGLT